MNAYRVVTGILKSRTALHIGTGGGSDLTDDLCRRDAAGSFIIPGTAIGGALRAIATRLAPRLGGKVCRSLMSRGWISSLPQSEREGPCGCPACHLFGDINPREGETEETGGRASRLNVSLAIAELPSDQTARIRDGVGIDRISRASADKVKFDLEVLPANAEFSLRLELEESNESDEQLLAATLAEWQEGRAWLGGRVGRGLGAFCLRDVKLWKRDLACMDGLMAFLKTDEPWRDRGDGALIEETDWLEKRLGKARKELRGLTACHEGVGRSYLTVKFDLKIEGAFISNDTTAAVRSGFDHAPLLNMIKKQGSPVLPGASLRGVMRSQAERIARTLTTLEVADREDFLAKCPACNPVESGESAPLANCDTMLRKKGVEREEEEISDEQLCLACRLFGSTRRGSRFIVEDSMALAELADSSKVMDFLAIDRFTGGGREGAKFDTLALWQPSFRVRLYLENPRGWELGWLFLALRDLATGLVPVGFGPAKGFGQARIESFVIQYGFISDDDFAGAIDVARSSAQPSSGLYRVIVWDTSDKAQNEQWTAQVETWVNAFNHERKQINRKRELRCEKDSYFEGDLPSLYEKDALRWLTEH